MAIVALALPLVLLPWLCNLGVLIHYCKTSKPRPENFWAKIFFSWCCVLLVILIPIFSWDKDNASSIDVLSHLADRTYTNVQATLSHALRYILPFVIYPLIIFWLKTFTNYRSDAVEQEQTSSGAAPGSKFEQIKPPHHSKNEETKPKSKDAQIKSETESDRVRCLTQSRLITFALQMMVLVFICFNLLQSLGMETDRFIEFGTVFSLGLSWSMRDWLGCLWAGFMIAFTTRMTVGSRLRIGNNADSSGRELEVYQTGLIFTICKHTEDRVSKDDVQVLSYIPNSVLMSNGFILFSQEQKNKIKEET